MQHPATRFAETIVRVREVALGCGEGKFASGAGPRWRSTGDFIVSCCSSVTDRSAPVPP
ncbi:hypothetical protein SPHINGO391_450207 [Sphingomonas aurantiaca]|uniref:Uncharacterized protein n=1 Tax=Sphingomonas aurantiaca TaxID=185949 RepID=A0A5E7ZHA8_9SPHN|nr:hypothetical protein SPHINGO391_450207 [Sphingomonas aurantiaca]